MIDGGELQVIRSDDLRRALAGWPDRAAEARLTQQASEVIRANLLPLLLALDPGGSWGAGQRSAVQVAVANTGWNGHLEVLLETVGEIIALIELQIAD